MKLSAESICFRHLFPWCSPNLGGWNGIVAGAAGTIAASSVSIVVVALENNENGVN